MSFPKSFHTTDITEATPVPDTHDRQDRSHLLLSPSGTQPTPTRLSENTEHCLDMRLIATRAADTA
jgi:hypothetical protein